MQYYALTLGKKAPMVQWAVFAGRRPWLNMENPVSDLTLMLRGEGVGAVRPEATDRTGSSLEVTQLEGAEVPPGRAALKNLPPDQRRLLRLQIPFPGPHPVFLRDGVTGKPLLTLVPEIVHPGFLFSLLGEMRGSFAPEGFANFIETGTLFGHTTLHASYWFGQVHTIELSPELHALATRTLAHRDNIRCHHGNSGAVLPGLIPQLQGPSLFFLDAHWSGDSSVDWQQSAWGGYPVDTARIDDADLSEANRQVPLMQELEEIGTAHTARALVLIDDWEAVGQAGVGFPGEDWRNLDRDRILAWFDAHPRTAFHHQLDDKRYVWGLTPVPE